MFEIQKSGDKTISGEIGLDIRTHASPKVGQHQVSGGESVLCWHAAPVAENMNIPCTHYNIVCLYIRFRTQINRIVPIRYCISTVLEAFPTSSGLHFLQFFLLAASANGIFL